MPVRTQEPFSTRARRSVVAFAATAAIAVVTAACSGGDAISSDSASATSPPPSAGHSSSSTSTSSTTSTTTSTTSTTTTTIGPPPIPVADIRLQRGDEGDAVRALEAQLLASGYWLERADDGVFDESTRHAVVALQKTHGLERTGVFDVAAFGALNQLARPAARSTAGTIVEVDLVRQVMFLVRDGVVHEIYDVSTGKRAGTTPTGEYTITREINGIRNAPLGRLYRPKYFVGGVAIHGYPKVPAEPASHGCVRVTNAVMDHIWDDQLMPKGTPVWVYS